MSNYHRLRVGTVCINRTIRDPSESDFVSFYDSFGKNTGNFMFTEAIFRLIDEDCAVNRFDFDPSIVNKNFDVVVVPAANWLSEDADWDWLLAKFEKLTIPVIAMGLGLQAKTLRNG